MHAERIAYLSISALRRCMELAPQLRGELEPACLEILMEVGGMLATSQAAPEPDDRRDREPSAQDQDAALREIVRVLVEDHPDLTFDDYAEVLGISAEDFAALRQELNI